jgi:hypothetical protein
MIDKTAEQVQIEEALGFEGSSPFVIALVSTVAVFCSGDSVQAAILKIEDETDDGVPVVLTVLTDKGLVHAAEVFPRDWEMYGSHAQGHGKRGSNLTVEVFKGSTITGYTFDAPWDEGLGLYQPAHWPVGKSTIKVHVGDRSLTIWDGTPSGGLLPNDAPRAFLAALIAAV